MLMCQFGMHFNVQGHRNANVCKQTYDACCIIQLPAYSNGTASAEKVNAVRNANGSEASQTLQTSLRTCCCDRCR